MGNIATGLLAAASVCTLHSNFSNIACVQPALTSSTSVLPKSTRCCSVHLLKLIRHMTEQQAYCFQLCCSRATNPGEVLGSKAGTQHLSKHSWEAGVAGEVGKKVGALPMRQPCIRAECVMDGLNDVVCNVVCNVMVKMS